GLLLQGCPYLLRNLHDLVLEVQAVGVGCLAILACVRAVRSTTRRSLVTAGVSVAILAATSPYYAVYLALGCALCVPWSLAFWRGWLGLALSGALGCALILAPLWAVESGESGRLGAQYSEHGYRTVPGRMVQVDLVSPDGSGLLPEARRRAPPRDPTLEPAARQTHRGPPSEWERTLRRIPGGASLALATLLALVTMGSRRWALLALFLLLGGPGPALWSRAVGAGGGEDASGPLIQLLQALPLTSSMGNPVRLVAAYAVVAALAAGLAASRRPFLGIMLGVVAVSEALWTVPAWRLPSTPTGVDASVVDTLDGPTVVFPSGDPPTWHPGIPPKYSLFIAGRAGVSV
ncbi:MAG: hypothetical protein QGG40_22440, partial [Myxococcota bacterium]|nr:hypothetical protein [Myxococcota bacterium]